MSDPVLPDPGEQFRLWAGSRPAITAIAAATRISGKLAGGTAPAIRYQLVSGGHEAPGAGSPLLQVECWGTGGVEDDGKASELARALVSELPTFVGDFAGGRVAGADATYPFESPDPVTDRPRWIVQVRLLSHALS